MEDGRFAPGWHHPSRTQTTLIFSAVQMPRSMLSPANFAAAYGVASHANSGMLNWVPTDGVVLAEMRLEELKKAPSLQALPNT